MSEPTPSRVSSQESSVVNGHAGPPAVAGGGGAMNATWIAAWASSRPASSSRTSMVGLRSATSVPAVRSPRPSAVGRASSGPNGPLVGRRYRTCSRLASRRRSSRTSGMGDRDQRLGPLPQAQPEQLGDAPLGHDRPDVGPRRDDAGALAEGRRRSARRSRRPPSTGRAMIERPSGASAAPRMKSIWPPTPE